ncbi:MAG: acetate--CoA ligase family protein [Spirochaetaceae bacterium]|nr:acetate--CoA ligase family protein [Spirochaetaceae bacterium]
MSIKTWLKNLNIPGKPDEWEVKELFHSYNITTPLNYLVKPDTDFSNIALKSPYVVKVCDPDILHKTDVGGVKLNITSNLNTVIKNMQDLFSGSSILVEEMVPYSGIEFIIGALVDSDFGPALMVGAGGILTELYKDVKFRLAPLERKEALRMLKELTVADILQGYRGSKMDIGLLADLIVSVGRLVSDLGNNFNHLDINPVVFSEGQWVALDGMAILNS